VLSTPPPASPPGEGCVSSCLQSALAAGQLPANRAYAEIHQEHRLCKRMFVVFCIAAVGVL
jgi:hypothetical protein